MASQSTTRKYRQRSSFSNHHFSLLTTFPSPPFRIGVQERKVEHRNPEGADERVRALPGLEDDRVERADWAHSKEDSLPTRNRSEEVSAILHAISGEVLRVHAILHYEVCPPETDNLLTPTLLFFVNQSHWAETCFGWVAALSCTPRWVDHSRNDDGERTVQ